MVLFNAVLTFLVISMSIILLALLIGTQIYLERCGLPARIANLRLLYFLLGGVAVIALAMILGTLLHVAVPLTAGVTVVISVGIAYKFRHIHDDLEKGKI